MTALRLDHLSLTNFRCFPRCEIGFHPNLTVLVAENGSGKTAVLDAAAMALSAIVNTLFADESLLKLQRSDVRLVRNDGGGMTPSLPTEYRAQGVVQGSVVSWGSAVARYGDRLRPTRGGIKPVRTAANAFVASKGPLPLIAYYGTGRLWSQNRLTEHRRTSLASIDERVTAYVDSLSPMSSFKGISTWYRRRFAELSSPAFRESQAVNLAMIEGVRAATDRVLEPTGWSGLHWDDQLVSLAAENPAHGHLPLFMLSDGVRTMLALVADVARRCASLNPHLSDRAPHETPGILMIDEVDMHLHPRWQQQILDLLRNAFPSLQIIASTHSPHVLSTVEKSSIRVLHTEGAETIVETPPLQTRGVESADVLASVMGVDPVPRVVESCELSAYRALIEDGGAETSEALRLRRNLIAHFGEAHPVILEADRLLRFQKFRLTKPQRDDK